MQQRAVGEQELQTPATRKSETVRRLKIGQGAAALESYGAPGRASARDVVSVPCQQRGGTPVHLRGTELVVGNTPVGPPWLPCDSRSLRHI